MAHPQTFNSAKHLPTSSGLWASDAVNNFTPFSLTVE